MKDTLQQNLSGPSGQVSTGKATAGDVENLMENELQCSICSELFIRATMLNCCHTFCKYCISTWKETKVQCPICRTPITSECRVRILDSLIESMAQASKETKQAREKILEDRNELEAGQSDQWRQSSAPTISNVVDVGAEGFEIEINYDNNDDDYDGYVDNDLSDYNNVDDVYDDNIDDNVTDVSDDYDVNNDYDDNDDYVDTDIHDDNDYENSYDYNNDYSNDEHDDNDGGDLDCDTYYQDDYDDDNNVDEDHYDYVNDENNDYDDDNYNYDCEDDHYNDYDDDHYNDYEDNHYNDYDDDHYNNYEDDHYNDYEDDHYDDYDDHYNNYEDDHYNDYEDDHYNDYEDDHYNDYNDYDNDYAYDDQDDYDYGYEYIIFDDARTSNQRTPETATKPAVHQPMSFIPAAAMTVLIGAGIVFAYHLLKNI